jgi:hypothetical protein
MRPFLYKLLLFSILSLVISSIIIVLIPYDRKYGYYSLSGDYRKGSWIYARIFNDPDNIDIAFIGTSHTLNAVVDSLIQNQLTESFRKPVKVANLALPHEGRNLQYTFIKDLLSNKNPNLIVLEVCERESIYSHFAFPYIAEGKDILFPRSIFNFNLIRDWSNALKIRLGYLKDKYLLNINSGNLILTDSNKFGFGINPESITIEELKARKAIFENQLKFYENPLLSKILFRFNRTYLKSISEITYGRTKIVFLYISNYDTGKKIPFDYEFYLNFGDVWIPPDSIISNPENWANYTHFNFNGAKKFSYWISGKIVENEY